ncbi:MAG: hypothetical protein FJZ09_06610 [Candidatus Omnitrophica bacterium]|nr:hypothetical protein [Candidatus Omnitrophota bacterium]
MWLVTTSIAEVGVTAAKVIIRKDYKLGFLALMLWGAAAMILVDHVLGYEGGKFLEKTTDGMIHNSAILGVAMLVPVLAIWGISLLISNLKRR